MNGRLTPRHFGRHSARVAAPEAPRNVADVTGNVAVTSSTVSATPGAAGNRGATS